MRLLAAVAWVGLSGALVLPAPAARAHEAHVESLPEPGPSLFEPPEPGSYELPSIFRVPEHRLLAPDGVRSPVLGLAEGQVAIVSFIYRSCSQSDGCPLALATLQRLDRDLVDRPGVRLVTVSFDPERDTPKKMAELRAALAPRGDWRFLTAAGPDELEPVLRAYGQDVVRVDAGSDLLRHVLKVFLVDSAGAVRNVYSTGFLDTRLILADVETLLGAE